MVRRPLASGNLCTGFLIAVTFLRANGLVFTGKEMPVVEMISELAAGEASESSYAIYLKVNSRPP
jgi:prophage maintenance system killer protein